MKRNTRNTYLFWIGISELFGVLAGLLTRGGMKRFLTQAVQPGLMPPAILFPIAWTILYALMGIGTAQVQLYGRHTKKAIRLFLLQLLFNFSWPFFFFNATAYGLALVWLIALWVQVLMMALEFEKQYNKAGLLQIPYLIWLLYAGFLNLAVWQLNS